MLRSWILFALTLLSGAFLAAGYNSKIGFAILYGAWLYLLMSAISILVAPWSLQVEESVSNDTVFKGEEFFYSLTIKNRGIFLYPRIVFGFYHSDISHFDERRLPVGAGEPLRTVTRQYTIRYPYRGVYHLGVERVDVVDLFGLFKRTLQSKRPITVTALPVSDEQFAITIREEPQYIARKTFHEDYAVVADIRRFDNTDSLRKVHWKLSAKRGELMVKSYHHTEQGRTVLYLDTVRLPLDSQSAAFEDRMIGCLAAAVDHCLLGNVSAELIYGERGIDQTTVSPGQELGIYALLAGIRFDREHSPVAALEQMEGDDNIMIFLAVLDEVVHDAIKERISFDHDVTLYFFYNKVLPLAPETEALLDSLEAWGVGVHKVDLDREVGV